MKHVLVISILTILFSTTQSYVQGSEYTWANHISGSINDAGDGITMDSHGNVFVSGTFSDTLNIGAITLESTGSSDSFIIKYDRNGNLLWARSSENDGKNMAYGVSTDPFGNCILTGRFYDSVTFDGWTLTSSGKSDIYIIKFDSNGSVIWARKAGGIGEDVGRAISVNNLGEIFISGCFDKFAYFNSVILSGSEAQLFITKYDLNGNVVWAQNTNVLYSRGIGPHITSDNFGNCFMTTHKESSTGTNIYVAKYNPYGNLVWSRIINGKGQYNGQWTSEYSRGIAVDGLGNVFVAGEFEGVLYFASDILSCSGWDQTFVAKYDPAGNEIWARKICGAHYESSQNDCINTDNNGNVITTGYFENSICIEGTTLTSKAYSEDIFLCKYDNNGNLLWAISNGGGSYDRGHGVAANECGNIVAIGSFRSAITFGSTTLYCPSDYDLFVTKITKTCIGDFDRNCQVDIIDFIDLAIAWLSEIDESQWNQECDISELKDNKIDFKDFLVFSEHWLQGVE